jgi:DNA polymerase I-like protein with 3'-5' exonuclease and polymerase domains
MQSYEYKLINYEVQGSAADLTKEALIQWNRSKEAGCRFLVTVYDEINLSAVTEERERHMTLLRECHGST